MSWYFRLLGVVLICLTRGIQAKALDDGLREVETIDENGAKWVRIVDERTHSKVTQVNKKTQEPTTATDTPGIDDEDGDERISSGDGRMENRDFQIAYDEPMKPSNDTYNTTTTPAPTKHGLKPNDSSTAKSLGNAITTLTVVISTTEPAPPTSSVPVFTTVKPTQANSTTKTITPATARTVLATTAVTGVRPTTGSSNNGNATTTTKMSTQFSTKAHDTTKSVSQIETTATQASAAKSPTTMSSVATAKPVLATTLETTQKTTTEVTKSAKSPTTDDEENTTIMKPTHLNVSKTNARSTPKESVAITASLPTNKPTEISRSTEDSGGVIRGQDGPTPREKRKVLFGFVTLEILIALLAGALFSVLLVAFLVYRLKKRNEGSYELSETIALRPKELDEMGKKKEVFV